MQKLAVAALVFSWAPLGYCAQALISGQGQVLSSPDYVELSILVDSKCYSTPDDARQVNDEASRKIVDFLNAKIKKKDNYNIVISTGGYTLPYETYYQDKFLCQNTYQKQNTIIFRTQELEHFETLFNDIQNMIYKQFKRTAPTIIDSSVSFVIMSNPTPSITDALRTQLEQKAIALAFNDASQKLSALFGNQKMQNVKMIDASEFSPDEPTPFYAQSAAPMALMRAGGMNKQAERAPVQFEEQTIKKTIYFRFTFDDIVIP